MIKVKVINKSNNELPKYETAGAAGMDARASFKNLNPRDIKQYGPQIVYTCETIWEDVAFEDGTVGAASRQLIKSISLQPGSRVLIPTDLYVEIPEGYEIQVRMRSGLALKQGLVLVNGLGTIDSDYRGNIGVILLNTSDRPVDIAEGDRICQFVLNKVEQIEWKETNNLEESDRGEGGFNSTGIK